MAPGIDLHIHSTASDGTFSPQAIIAKAIARKLSAIAITDHDTIAAYQELESIALPADLEIITGVEISADWPPGFGGKGSLHILGYAFDVRDPDLNQLLQRLNEARTKRIPRMLERLRRLDIPIRIQDLAQHKDHTLGRPHIAEWLVRHGHVASIDMAFDTLIGNGRPAYVDKERVPCEEALRIIRKAGGFAVLAHPGVLNISPGALFESFLKTLQAIGLCGLEAYYPEHGPVETAYFKKVARNLGLRITGGTDFHGDLIPNLEMGTGYGDFRVPAKLLTGLRAGSPVTTGI